MVFILLSLFAIAIASLAVIAAGLRRAPEAYEDEDGFHIIRRRASSSGVLLRRKHAKGHGAGPLKEAGVNP